MIDETLKKLIEFIQQATPALWQTLIKQVYAVGVANVVYGIVALAIALAFLVLAARLSNFIITHGESDETPTSLAASAGAGSWAMRLMSILAGICSVQFFFEGLARLYNPEYYAILLILDKIK